MTIVTVNFIEKNKFMETLMVDETGYGDSLKNEINWSIKNTTHCIVWKINLLVILNLKLLVCC